MFTTGFTIGIEVIPLVSFVWGMKETRSHSTGILFAVLMALLHIEDKDLVDFLLSIHGL